MLLGTVNLDAETPARPAKKPVSKRAPKPASKPAPAETASPAKPAAARPLRWVLGTEYAGGKEQTAVAGDRAYAISHTGEKAWKATVTVNGTESVLAEGGFGKCYTAITAHHKSA